MDFNSCANWDGFPKSIHICRVLQLDSQMVHINLKNYICKLNHQEDSHFLQDINQKNYEFDVQQLTNLTKMIILTLGHLY